jgi:hypothetical protein
MAQTAVTADFHQPLDVEVDLTAEISFNDKVTVDVLADSSNFFFREITHPSLRLNTDRLRHLGSTSPANAVDIGQRDLNLLLGGDIHTSYSRHVITSS